jgi:hypothetical protein
MVRDARSFDKLRIALLTMRVRDGAGIACASSP